jgi:hypothetical protein
MNPFGFDTTWTYEEHFPPSITKVFSAGGKLFIAIDTQQQVAAPGSRLARMCPVRISPFTLSVCYGNGAYLSADSSSIKRSVTLPEWCTTLDLTNYHGASFKGLAFDGQRFCAVASNGTLFLSKDGIVWDARAIDTSAILSGIVSNGSSFAAYSSEEIWLLSADDSLQKVWSGKTGIDLHSEIVSLSFTGSRYYVQTVTEIATSEDCRTWEEIKGPTSYSNSNVAMFQSNGTSYVAVGIPPCSRSDYCCIWASDDGLTWTPVVTEVLRHIQKSRYLPLFRLYGICTISGVYLAAGAYDTIITSTDGRHWVLEHQQSTLAFDRIEHSTGGRTSILGW